MHALSLSLSHTHTHTPTHSLSIKFFVNIESICQYLSALLCTLYTYYLSFIRRRILTKYPAPKMPSTQILPSPNCWIRYSSTFNRGLTFIFLFIAFVKPLNLPIDLCMFVCYECQTLKP